MYKMWKVVLLIALSGVIASVVRTYEVPCGNGMYNPVTHQCCGGIKETRQANKRCCRLSNGMAVTYFTTKSICCDGQKIPILLGSQTRKCCGKTNIIFTHNQTCCAENPQTFLAGVDRINQRCCYDRLIDLTKDMCCRDPDNKSLVSIKKRMDDDITCCSHQTMNRRFEWCKNRRTVLSKTQDKCGDVIIQVKKQSCCRGKVNDFPSKDPDNVARDNPHFGCCGTSAINVTMYKCCSRNGHRIPNKPDLRCCGQKGFFNISNEICCGGVKSEKMFEKAGCCGTKQYNTLSQGCCGRFQEVYNRSTHFCPGHGQGPLLLGTPVCGGKEIFKNQICCRNILHVNKSDKYDDSCCLNYRKPDERIPFNSEKKICNPDGTLSSKKPNFKSCGGKDFDPKKQICCQNHYLYHHPPGGTLQCCQPGRLAYDERFQTCCKGYGTVANISTNEAECCRGEAFKIGDPKNKCNAVRKCGQLFFNPTFEICCEGKKYNKKNSGDDCCQDKPYFNDEKKCCQGVLHRDSKQNGLCCGTDLLNAQKKYCCRGAMGYNDKRSVCQRNGIVKQKRNRPSYRRLCRPNQWTQTDGFAIPACWSKYAFTAKVLGVSDRRRMITVYLHSVKDLHRNLQIYHGSINTVPNRKAMLILKIRTDGRNINCHKTLRKNLRLIVFTANQAIHWKGTTSEITFRPGDRFYVMRNTRKVRKTLHEVTSYKYCVDLLHRMKNSDLKWWGV